MPEKFYELAAYNREVFHRRAYPPEYVARMETLQREFDEWADEVRQAF
jgi:hypothetical protein